jgi:DNA-binding CsgD family transcriptional regulator
MDRMERSSADAVVWKAATTIAEAATVARSAPELGQQVMEAIDRLVGCDLGSIITVTAGQNWSLCGEIADNQYLKEHFWRTAMALEPKEVEAVSTGFTSDQEVFSMRRKERLAVFREFLWPHRLRTLLVRMWFQSGRAWALGIARTGSTLAARQRGRLEQLYPFIHAAMRVAAGLTAEPADPYPDAGRGGPWGLTPAQERTLSLVIRGMTNREVAALLGTSPNTVRNTLTEIFKRVGVSTRSELAFVACSECRQTAAWNGRAPETARREAFLAAIEANSRDGAKRPSSRGFGARSWRR